MPLRVTLIIGSFNHESFTQSLFDLYLPESQPAPQHPDEPMYHVLPEIQHTFRPEPKTPYVLFSGIGTCAVVAPWVLLIGLVCLHFNLCCPPCLCCSIIVPYTTCATSLILIIFFIVEFHTISPTPSLPPINSAIRRPPCLLRRASLLVLGPVASWTSTIIWRNSWQCCCGSR